MRKTFSFAFHLLILLYLGAASAGAQATPSGPEERSFSDDHIRITVLSAKKTGGTISLVATYENFSNSDCRINFYNGGANGRNTILVDSNGEQWEMSDHTERGKQLLSSGSIRVSLTFTKPVGDVSASSFSLVNYIQMLPEHGDETWIKATISDIPASYSRPAQAAQAPQAPRGSLEFTDSEYLHARVLSSKQTGGTIKVSLLYENVANVAYRIAHYHGGANGNETVLVDSNGDQWTMKENNLAGKQFLPHVATKVTLTFVRETGGANVASVTLIVYAQILNVAGASLDADWVKFSIPGIPPNYQPKP